MISRICDTPFGAMLLTAENKSLTGLYLPNCFPAYIPSSGESDVLVQTELQLSEYFAGKRRKFDVPLSVSGTDFQKKVWMGLCTIPYGSCISYGELAKRIGHPGAARAAGQANHHNPIAIIIPCHRVIAASGRIGGYGGGLPLKRKLLALEGFQTPELNDFRKDF